MSKVGYMRFYHKLHIFFFFMIFLCQGCLWVGSEEFECWQRGDNYPCTHGFDSADSYYSYEPAGEPSGEASPEPSGEPAGEAYTGPLPGVHPGCTVEYEGIPNSGLYCFEGAWITADNCSNSYLEFQADGCPADNVVAVCLEIPPEGDYLDFSNGFYYEGAVGTEDACNETGGSWEYIGD